jgi:hypothetical protein
MEKRNRIFITALLLGFFIIGFYLVTYSITHYTGYSVSENKMNDFEVCINSKDIVLYINSNNPSDTLKDEKTFEYLRDIKIMNCFRDNQNCVENGVNSFPTWIIEKNKIERDISVAELSEFSGCKYS